MIVKFTDDYVNILYEAHKLVGLIGTKLCKLEKIYGRHEKLDNLTALSIAISGIIDHLEHDDNGDPNANESMLQCLKQLINKNIC